MTLHRSVDGSFVQDCFSRGNGGSGDFTLESSNEGWREEGRISVPCAWGTYRDPATPANSVLLEVHRHGVDDYRLRVHRPFANAELLDELLESEAPHDATVVYWEFSRENGEDPETFMNVLRVLGETHRKRVAGLLDHDGAEHRAAAEELARGILLWRYGVRYHEDRADTARAKGLWGELTVLSYLEDERKTENASACWRPFGAKWDIELVDDEVRRPLEVKTTMRNTHTHELRHSQLDEGRRCDLLLVSVRCAEDGSDSEPTLEEMLRARGDAATALGKKGSECAERVALELARLSPKEKTLRLRQEGTIVSVRVEDLPPFPSFPATYRELKYTVDLEFSGSPTDTGPSSGGLPSTKGVVGLAIPGAQPRSFVSMTVNDEKLVAHEEQSGHLVQDHELAVQWAVEHQGSNMTWQHIERDGQLLGIDLIIHPKGIYKPKDAQIVRSVRSSHDSVYAASDETGVLGWWYSLEKSGSSKKGAPSKFTVHLVWVTEFDFTTGRCFLSTSPASTLPADRTPPTTPLLKPYTNRGLWQNYVSQTPLVYFEGF